MIAPLLLLAEPSHARARLVTEVVRAAAGRPFLAAVEIDTDPHWHVYWTNPGDSGIPTKIDWSAPKGWRVEPLVFPTPRRFAPGGVTAYGYEGKTLFLARVTPSSASGSLAARVKWLVCSQACIAGAATVAARLPVGSAKGGPMSLRLRNAAAALPAPRPFAASARVGKAVVLTVDMAGKAVPGWRGAEFFPAVSGVVDQSKPFSATLRNGSLVFKMDVSPFPEAHDRLPGLVVFTSGARRDAVLVNPRLQKGETP